MTKKCEHIKNDGTKCNAYALSNSIFCFSHDPSKAKEKKAAVTKGGRQLKKPKVDKEVVSISKTEDVSLLLIRCINEVRQGELSPKEANAIGYLANILLNSIKQSGLDDTFNGFDLRRYKPIIENIIEFEEKCKNDPEEADRILKAQQEIIDEFERDQALFESYIKNDV